MKRPPSGARPVRTVWFLVRRSVRAGQRRNQTSSKVSSGPGPLVEKYFMMKMVEVSRLGDGKDEGANRPDSYNEL